MSEQETTYVIQIEKPIQMQIERMGQDLCQIFINDVADAERIAFLDCLQERTKETAGERLQTMIDKGRAWVLKQEYARWFAALLPLWRLVQHKEPAVVAIDGRCGSGKTTLAELGKEVFGGRVFHMDDYYLPLAQRKPDWEHVPAGNMDLNRFRSQVLEPVRLRQSVQYIPYSCQAGRYEQAKQIAPAALTIIEGSYCQHPELTAYYDMTLFLTCTPEEQEIRLRKREGNFFGMFQRRWIPMEEAYFTACDVPKRADARFDTTVFFVCEIG